jgi:hypothetical protein
MDLYKMKLIYEKYKYDRNRISWEIQILRVCGYMGEADG